MKRLFFVFGSLFKLARLSSALLISYWFLSRHFSILEQMQSGQWSWAAFIWYFIAVMATLALMISWGRIGWKNMPERLIEKIWNLDKDVFFNSSFHQLQLRFGFWQTEKKAWISYAYCFYYILNACGRIMSLLFLILISGMTGGKYFRKPALRILDHIND
jgi:hypothetical protein